MSSDSSNPVDFPALFKGRIKEWKIANYSKEDWCDVFKDKPLKFRQGKRAFTRTPFWEHLCSSKEMTLKEFFQVSMESCDQWLYFDYKYLRDVFSDDKTFISEIKWSDLNLVGLDKEESALWIGNEGAHTPCHKDTYGYNMVAQLFGRKMWILMPPEEGERLEPVRVPYEESSIYSSHNFFMPSDHLLRVQRAYKVILDPGDVLYVPRHWWHYVENLEPAISINIWVPLAEDYESRLEESLVQHYVSMICKDLAEKELKQILNPNAISDLVNEPCKLRTVVSCLEWYRKQRKERGMVVGEVRNEVRGEEERLEKLDVKAYIEERSRTFNYDTSEGEPETELCGTASVAKILINAYCQPSNIAALKDLLLKHNFN